MPPFGSLYGMDVYVDESLTKDEKIAFNAGPHYMALQIAYADFERLVWRHSPRRSSSRAG